MAEHLYLWSGFPDEDLHHIVGSKSLIQFANGFQHHHCFGFGFVFFFWISAIVALTTILIRILFSEIAHQQFSTANTGFGKGNGFTDQLRTHFAFAEWFIPHQVFEFADVFVRIIKHTFSFESVTTGPPGFLIIVLDRFGNVVVNHKTDIRLVNAHPEGDGGTDHLYVFTQELILTFGTEFAVQSGVIRHCLDAIGFE